MKACDEKLKSCLMEAMELDDARLEEEMKHCEPHVFSYAFEEKMQELMKVQKRKSKAYAGIRYIAAAVITLLLTGGILFIGSEEAHASVLGIDILEWLDKFFTVEDGDHRRKEESILFDESQIGYLPEGFEKSGESVTFSLIQYEYGNKHGDNIVICVSRTKSLLQIDNEDISKDVHLNEAGYEYTLTQKKQEVENTVLWVDENEVYYRIISNIDQTELIKIMNGIVYD